VTLIILRVADLAAALLDGLSEQPAGYVDGIRDLRHDAISEVITEFVNTLLDGSCATALA
jgi:hypothetical protein